MTFVADNMAAGILVGKRWGAETSIWERDPARFGFSDPPPLILDQKTHFVLHIFCCFAITTRVQQ